MARLALSVLACLLSASLYGQVEALRLRPEQGPQLSADWYHEAQPRADMILVVPGFAQHRGTANMRFVAGLLSPTADVLVLDLRGTGSSQGVFTFGAEEAQDVQVALAWAKQRYAHVDLLGFSLGAYSSLRAVSEGPLRPEHCLLVSAPDRLEGILSSGGVWQFMTHGLWAHDDLVQAEEGDPFFDWGPLFMAKPNGSELAAALPASLPVHFLAGGRDELVFPWISRRLFEAAPRSTFTVLGPGRHAEHMCLQAPDHFMAWVQGARHWDGQGRVEDPFHLDQAKGKP